MARIAQTETAVLGVLNVEPMTGYAIRVAIRDVLGHFWHESFGQIYPTLARLEEEGRVVRRGPGSRGGSTFAITSSGRARLVELLGEAIQEVPPRNALLLRVFFGRALGQAATAALLGTAREEALATLASLAATRGRIAAESAEYPDRPYWEMTISAGEHAARARIAWIDECLAILAE